MGVLVSLYAYCVEANKHAHHGYEAMCDISSTFSCSKILTSKQSRLLLYFGIVSEDSVFNIPNSVLGMYMYAC